MKSNKIRIVCAGEMMRRTEQIIPYERETKRHGEEQITKLRESLRAFGFVRPLLIDEADRLVYGSGVLAAAKAEGMAEVPCNVAHGLTEAQRRGYTQADNRLSELGTWDEESLRAELADLAGLGLDLEIMGFSADDLGLQDQEEEAEDKAAEKSGDNFHYKEQYGVIVMCADEAQQQEVYEDLTARGYECKVVAT